MPRTKSVSDDIEVEEMEVTGEPVVTSPFESLTKRRDHLLNLYNGLKVEGFNSIGDLENGIAKLNQEISSL